jgi:hypothetical protein
MMGTASGIRLDNAGQRIDRLMAGPPPPKRATLRRMLVRRRAADIDRLNAELASFPENVKRQG